MPNVFRSSAFNLAFSYVALAVGALILFAAPLWYAWQATIEAGRKEILRVDAQRLTDVFHRDGPQGLKAYIDARLGLQIASERSLLMADPALHPLAGNLAAWPKDLPQPPGLYIATLEIDGQPTRAMVVHVALGEGYHLLVGRDVARFEPLERHFWNGLAAAVAVLSIVGVVGGLMIRRALLNRVHSTQQTVSAIMQGNLSHRLPTPRGNDEFDTLTRTMNRMLDQIEQLVHGIRDVSNSIAHDLRTPLAELRSRLEELALTKPPPQETFAEIDGAVADVDRVIRIFNALLRLAEIDTGTRRAGFVEVNAVELAGEAVEFYLPAAELKGMHLSFTGTSALTISGDPTLLAQAVANLLDNAMKFGVEGGRIDVNVAQHASGATQIVVDDNGPGIPQAEMAKVTERFYRVDASRGTPGVGLGLTLVAAVAKLHGGRLELADNAPGLHAAMILDPQGAVSQRDQISRAAPPKTLATPVIAGV